MQTEHRVVSLSAAATIPSATLTVSAYDSTANLPASLHSVSAAAAFPTSGISSIVPSALHTSTNDSTAIATTTASASETAASFASAFNTASATATNHATASTLAVAIAAAWCRDPQW